MLIMLSVHARGFIHHLLPTSSPSTTGLGVHVQNNVG